MGGVSVLWAVYQCCGQCIGAVGSVSVLWAVYRSVAGISAVNARLLWAVYWCCVSEGCIGGTRSGLDRVWRNPPGCTHSEPPSLQAVRHLVNCELSGCDGGRHRSVILVFTADKKRKREMKKVIDLITFLIRQVFVNFLIIIIA